ncbi:MAG: hypothetical protein QXN55_08580 [Candidatus Nitrosotenuis sp.]
MEYDDLLKILNGDISHIDCVTSGDIALYSMQVTVLPKHVRKMLWNYLAGKISAEELSRWANFLCLRAEYSSVHYLDDKLDDSLKDKLADYYEDMWYVIQRLSTPEIDGEIDEARVRSYLDELKKYPD